MERPFISYVREDERLTDFICKLLTRNGLEYWRDKNNIDPGSRWKTAIVRAIESGSHFVPLFTNNYVQKQRSVANEELVIAIEQLRLMPLDRKWFIAVKLDNCEIPDRPIGGGETLRDLQWIDFPKLGWKEGLRRLVRALGAESPILDYGEPIGAGLPSLVKIVGGKMTYRGSNPPVEGMDGLIMGINGGMVMREEGIGLVINLISQAPFEKMQLMNEKLGLANFTAFCEEQYISSNIESPNSFVGDRTIRLNKGEQLWHYVTGDSVVPMDMDLQSTFTATGILTDDVIHGRFDAIIKLLSAGTEISTWGDFEVKVES